jgi:hypothetical protein
MLNITEIPAVQDNLADVNRALLEANSKPAEGQAAAAAKDKLVSELEAVRSILERALADCRIRREYFFE